MKKSIISKNAPEAVGPYSQAIEVGGTVYLSGQIHKHPVNGMVEGSIEDKTKQVMENLNAVLTEAGLDFSHVVKTEIFLTDMADYAKVNETYASFLSEPYPARYTVGVKELPAGATVEIAMTAVRG